MTSSHRDTSAEAFNELVHNGKLAGWRRRVAAAFSSFGPGTSAEVLSAAGLDRNRNLMRARVTELADDGYLLEEAPRKCQITGRRAIVWRFTHEPKPREKIKTSKELAVDNAKLVARCNELENENWKLHRGVERGVERAVDKTIASLKSDIDGLDEINLVDGTLARARAAGIAAGSV